MAKVKVTKRYNRNSLIVLFVLLSIMIPMLVKNLPRGLEALDYWIYLRARKTIHKAILCIPTGDYKEAIPILEKSLKMTTTNEKILKSEIHQGYNQKNYFYAYYLLGVSYEELGDRSKAREFYKKADPYYIKHKNGVPAEMVNDYLYRRGHNLFEMHLDPNMDFVPRETAETNPVKNEKVSIEKPKVAQNYVSNYIHPDNSYGIRINVGNSRIGDEIVNNNTKTNTIFFKVDLIKYSKSKSINLKWFIDGKEIMHYDHEVKNQKAEMFIEFPVENGDWKLIVSNQYKKLYTYSFQVSSDIIILPKNSASVSVVLNYQKDWQVSIVDSAPKTGAFNSITVDRQNNPHILYSAQTKDPKIVSVMYAKLNKSNWMQTDVGNMGKSNELFGGIAMDSYNRVHLAYAGPSIKRKYLKDDKWIINKNYTTGNLLVMTLDSQDNYHLVSLNKNGISHSRTKNSSSTNIRVVDAESIVGIRSIGLAVDSKNNPWVSYYDAHSNSLKFSHLENNKWIGGLVSHSNSGGKFSKMAIDSKDNLYFAYTGKNNELFYTQKIYNKWRTVRVDKGPVLEGSIDIAVTKDNEPYISYMVYTAGKTQAKLKYAFRDYPKWGTKTIYSLGSIKTSSIYYTSLAMDSENAPHISFYDSNTQTLKYATTIE